MAIAALAALVMIGLALATGLLGLGGSTGADELAAFSTRQAPSTLPQAAAEGRTIAYSYDAVGRLTGVNHGGGISITYTYDRAGNLLVRQAIGPATTPTATAPATVTPTATSPVSTATATPTTPPTRTITASATATSTPTGTHTPVTTSTAIWTPAATSTPALTGTAIGTPGRTATPTYPATGTSTSTPAPTLTGTPASTATSTPTSATTATPHATATGTPAANASLLGGIRLQARGAAPSARWVVTLTVTLHPPGVAAPTYERSTTTDNYGQFRVDGIAPGAYDVKVKRSRSLTNRKANVTLVSCDPYGQGAPCTYVNLGLLLEGDANDDGVVNSLDYAPLASAYFKQTGQAGFDARVDFNEDGRINSSDYAPLASNYFKRSDIEVP